MNRLPDIIRLPEFDADVDRQAVWYLLQSDLLPDAAADLASRFADAVETALDQICRHPEIGRRRAVRFSDLPGFRAWKLPAPFGRFRIYYRVTGENLLQAVRLLDGHALAASEKP